MFPLSKVLLPVDFSERCLGAARYAQALASRWQGELTLLHVLEPLRYEFSTLEFGGAVMNDLSETRTAETRRQLDGFLREELRDTPVQRVLLEGDPARQIIEYAHAHSSNLIAMPTHGYGPFRRFILGSVTAKVLHDADCPVLTGIHMEQTSAGEPVAIRTVVCAVDLGPQSKKALCWASRMAGEFGAKLFAVHAIPCIESRPGEYFDRELVSDLATRAKEEMCALLAEMHAVAEPVAEGGDAPSVVCRLAQDLRADLLIIGRGSAAGMFGRLRTNAYAIIRGSPCGVVSV